MKARAATFAIWIVAQGQTAPIQSSTYPDRPACVEGLRVFNRALAGQPGARWFIPDGKPAVRIERVYCAPAAPNGHWWQDAR